MSWGLEALSLRRILNSMAKGNVKRQTKLVISQHLKPIIEGADDPWCKRVGETLRIYSDAFLNKPTVHTWMFTPTSVLADQMMKAEGARAINATYWKDIEQGIDGVRHLFIARGDSLVNTCLSLLNKADYLAAAIIARVLFEHSIWSLGNAGKIHANLTHMQTELPDIDMDKSIVDNSLVQDIIFLCVWGTRIGERVKAEPGLQQMNVLSVMKEVDAKEGTGYIERLYDYLCDACHPNAIGNHQFISYPDWDSELEGPTNITISDHQMGIQCADLAERTLAALAWSCIALVNANEHLQKSLEIKKQLFDQTVH